MSLKGSFEIQKELDAKGKTAPRVQAQTDNAKAKAIEKFWFGEGYALRKSLDNLKGEFHE